MIKQLTVYAVTVFTIIAWIGIFFPPEIGGTAVRAVRVETVCYTNCPGHHNTGHLQLEHG